MLLHYGLSGFLWLGELGGAYSSSKESQTKPGRIWILLTSVVFVGLGALRRENVGNDTAEYARFFREVCASESVGDIWNRNRYEPGYVLLNFVISAVSQNFNVLLAVIALVYVASVMYFINRFAAFNETAILAAFGMSVFYDFMVTARQSLAIAIVLVAFSQVFDKKPMRFGLLILLAACFHYSALVLLPVYFLSALKLRNFTDWLLAILALCCVMVGLNSVLGQVGAVSSYYGHYLESVYAGGGVRIATILALAVRVGMVVLYWSFSSEANKSAQVNVDMADKFKLFIVLDLVFLTMSTQLNLLDRFETFFTVPFVVGVINLSSRIHGSLVLLYRGAIAMLSVMYISLTLHVRPEWYGIFPYSVIGPEWLNK